MGKFESQGWHFVEIDGEIYVLVEDVEEELDKIQKILKREI